MPDPARGAPPCGALSSALQRPFWQGCRAGTDGRRRALDQRPQVDFGHHALLHQEFVGRVVGFEQVLAHVLLDIRLDRDPDSARQGGKTPLLDQMLGEHFGPQDVLLVQVRKSLPGSGCASRRSLSSQLAKSSRRRASREARILSSITSLPISSNLPLSSEAGGRVGGGNGLRIGPCCGGAANPGCSPLFWKAIQPSRRSCMSRALPGWSTSADSLVLNGFGQRGQYPCSTLRKQRASLLDQKTVLFVTWSHDRPG
jgi:hypothetical protein